MSVLCLTVVPKTHSKSVDDPASAAVVTQKNLEVMQLARARLLHQNRSPVVASERGLDRLLSPLAEMRVAVLLASCSPGSAALHVT